MQAKNRYCRIGVGERGQEGVFAPKFREKGIFRANSGISLIYHTHIFWQKCLPQSWLSSYVYVLSHTLQWWWYFLCEITMCIRKTTYRALFLAHSKNELMQWRGVRRLSVRRPSVNFCANRFFSQTIGRIATKLAHDRLQVSVHPGCAQGEGQGQRSRDTHTFLDSWNELLRHWRSGCFYYLFQKFVCLFVGWLVNSFVRFARSVFWKTESQIFLSICATFHR